MDTAKEISENETARFDVMEGVCYPHRILSRVTAQDVDAYCKTRGLFIATHHQLGVTTYEVTVKRLTT